MSGIGQNFICERMWSLIWIFPGRACPKVRFIVGHRFCKTDWSSINNRLVQNIFSPNSTLSQILIYCFRSIKGDSRWYFFLFLHENVCCGYSLEAPTRGASNEYPQHFFPWRNKKNISIFGLTFLRLFNQFCSHLLTTNLEWPKQTALDFISL